MFLYLSNRFSTRHLMENFWRIADAHSHNNANCIVHDYDQLPASYKYSQVMTQHWYNGGPTSLTSVHHCTNYGLKTRVANCNLYNILLPRIQRLNTVDMCMWKDRHILDYKLDRNTCAQPGSADGVHRSWIPIIKYVWDYIIYLWFVHGILDAWWLWLSSD